ncbi:MAG TPA: sugar phosphate isomerase/epimerase [Firmicutes bacterium]|nr:sugar phosphate isomerase/epimerase [Bacillota bacterium]HHY97547.1 sugar phosphate isomerase/epimerase [Bacillota bacterium]
MRLGFFTACFRRKPIAEVADWASAQGFTALEVACWPYDNTRDYSSTTIDVEALTPEEAHEINEMLKSKNLIISSLGYYDNMLHSDPRQREAHLRHLTKVMDAAHMLGVGLVGTFIGRNIELSVADNLKEAERVFSDIMKYAEDRNLRVMIENCPMVGWQQPGIPGNLAYSPELWDELFKRIPSESFGLNFDPSHLYWLGIDYIQAAKDYRDRIFHAHAKDVELLDEGYYRYGIFGSQLGSGHGKTFWRYRLPGLGEIDWARFISILYEIGLESGTLSIEHEDPIWEGTEEKLKAGLIMGRRHLAQYMP